MYPEFYLHNVALRGVMGVVRTIRGYLVWFHELIIIMLRGKSTFQMGVGVVGMRFVS